MKGNPVWEDITSTFVTIHHVADGKVNHADIYTKETDTPHFVELSDLKICPWPACLWSSFLFSSVSYTWEGIELFQIQILFEHVTRRLAIVTTYMGGGAGPGADEHTRLLATATTVVSRCPAPNLAFILYDVRQLLL